MTLKVTRAQAIKYAFSCIGSLACLAAGYGNGLREAYASGTSAAPGWTPENVPIEVVQRHLEQKTREYEEQILPYRVDVPLGQTAMLANVDAEIVGQILKTGKT